MMRRNQIIHEFDLLAEALPIVLAGILLNVAGRQIAEFFGGPFVDMTGTAFTAFLLGPWWAAAVAAATTIVNGNFFESYFPFGIVNIAGALVWGYLARFVDLPNRVFTWQKGSVVRFLLWTMLLTLAGGLACGLTSTCVKLVLYPQLGRPFIYGALYVSAQAKLQALFGSPTPEVLTLAAVDLFRDLADKLVVVPIAMVLVALSRIAPTFRRMYLPTTLTERLQTDVVSIFSFAVAYSAFIILAQITRPTISIPGSAHEIAWLGNPMMVVLLYAPLVLAILAFRFLTYRPTEQLARRLHALCRRRREVTRQLFEAGGRWTTVLRSTVTQALGTGVSMWPLRHVIDPLFGIPVALGAIIVALSGYLVMARAFYATLQSAMNKLETVHRWLEIGCETAASAGLVKLMQNLFANYFHVPVPQVSRRNGLLYSLAFVNRPDRGRLEEVLFGGTEDPVGERVAILATIEEPHALCVPLLQDLASLASDSGAGLVALASTTTRVTDDELIHWLRGLRKAGTEVLLLDGTDLCQAVAAKELTGRSQTSMRHVRARALHLLNSEDEKFVVDEVDPAKQLTGRALESLRVVIRSLPKSSIVFDLGSGYGRHTFLASTAGHEVLAVDRKKAVFDRLRDNLVTLPRKHGRVSVRHCDLRDVSVESSGLADLVICTGVLQHARDVDDLSSQLAHISKLAGQPAALIYIEMLFEMRFDGRPPIDGRLKITPAEFEGLLREVFPAASWAVQRSYGPMRQMQSFDQGGRSFEPPARTIESTAAEYLIRRLD
jgi:SAM-dependent methyltransferase